MMEEQERDMMMDEDVHYYQAKQMEEAEELNYSICDDVDLQLNYQDSAFPNEQAVPLE
jgi:hypothetical protein